MAVLRVSPWRGDLRDLQAATVTTCQSRAQTLARSRENDSTPWPQSTASEGARDGPSPGAAKVRGSG